MSIHIPNKIESIYTGNKFIRNVYFGKDLIQKFYKTPSSFTVFDLPSDAPSWRGLTYGAGKFVAVSYENNKAGYSVNGINWTLTTLPATRNWNSIDYGNGVFVAVATGGTYGAYSTDGTTWTQMSFSYDSQTINRVRFVNGKFFILTSSQTCYYSTNGINWTSFNMPYTRNWNDIAYGDGKYIAVGNTWDNYYAYSTDGINWTGKTFPINGYPITVDYANSKFVVVPNGRSISFQSTDGLTWSQVDMTTGTHSYYTVRYCGNYFIATMLNDPYVAYSKDGVTWYNGRISGGNYLWYSIAFNGTRIVLLPSNMKKGAYCDI